MVPTKDATVRRGRRARLHVQLDRRTCTASRPVTLSILSDLANLKVNRCALINCHRPELLDYNALDKVRGLSRIS